MACPSIFAVHCTSTSRAALQSAYRRSTKTAILKVTSDILLTISAGDLSALALLGLPAALDTVVRHTLLRRLELS